MSVVRNLKRRVDVVKVQKMEDGEGSNKPLFAMSELQLGTYNDPLDKWTWKGFKKAVKGVLEQDKSHVVEATLQVGKEMKAEESTQDTLAAATSQGSWWWNILGFGTPKATTTRKEQFLQNEIDWDQPESKVDLFKGSEVSVRTGIENKGWHTTKIR